MGIKTQRANSSYIYYNKEAKKIKNNPQANKIYRQVVIDFSFIHSLSLKRMCFIHLKTRVIRLTKQSDKNKSSQTNF